MLNQVFEPDKLYGTAIGDEPDLMVYFDELDWRSAGTIGHNSIYLSENDTGPDDSVHSMDGVFLMFNPQRNMNSSIIEGAKVEDTTPTLLKLFGADGVLKAE
jgi:predicted AlkP superfamily phosphohydrolase/phosphomutase